LMSFFIAATLQTRGWVMQTARHRLLAAET
jgi:hypothetical protein